MTSSLEAARGGGVALRAVTFDFWCTLFEVHDFNAEVRRRHLRAFVARHRAELPDEVVDAAFQAGVDAQTAHWKRSQHFGPESVIDHALAELRLEAPVEARAELRVLIEDPDPPRELVPVPGVREALEDLRRRGIKLGVVCDSGLMVGRVLRDRLARADLTGYFEPGALAFSDEVGVTKPRPEMFRAALDVLGVPPAEAAHVGDLKATDVAGARNLGMRSVRFKGFNDDPAEGPEAEVVIDDYRDLPAALGLPAL